MVKYKEIFKLKRMLEKENIPFDFIENLGYDKRLLGMYPDLLDHYQICYPSSDNRWISVVQGYCTYGGTVNRLEIMGGLTPLEKYETGDTVVGYLTAKNVFKRIKTHYDSEKKGKM